MAFPKFLVLHHYAMILIPIAMAQGLVGLVPALDFKVVVFSMVTLTFLSSTLSFDAAINPDSISMRVNETSGLKYLFFMSVFIILIV